MKTPASRFLMGAAALLAVFWLSGAAAAETPARRSTNIPAQGLGDALRAFEKDRQLQVIFVYEDVENLRTRGVSGKLTAEEALRRLLDGTGLTYRYVDPKTVSIFPQRSSGQSRVENAGEELKLARVTAADMTTDQAPPATDIPQQTEPAIEDEKGIPELLVRGKRSINSDIRRTEDDVQPYVVFDAQTIERSMASTVEEFLKTRLPMNTQQINNNQDPIGATGNRSTIDLRGLGANQTLILINGRRAPSVANNSVLGDFGQPDLNGIPVSSIERIEVLPSTASGIYGGGATGGVINVILKRDYHGIEVKGRYDNTFDSDATQRTLEATAGFSLEGGKTSIMLSGSYSDANELQVRERDFYQRARGLLLANNPNAFVDDFFYPPAGYTTNISGLFGEELVLDDGRALGTSYTHVPVGYTGVQSDGGQALIDNAGSYDLDLPNDLSGGRGSLLNNPRIESYAANVRRSFGDRIEAFIDLARYRNLGRTHHADAFFGVDVLADAPNNPFANDLLVTFPTIGLSAISYSMSQTTQASGGVIARLPRGWNLQADYAWSESRTYQRSASPMVSQAGLDAILDGPINVVRDLNLDPIDFSPYLLRDPNFIFGPSDMELGDLSLRLAGPVFTLPAGPVTVSALLERRTQEAQPTYQDSPDFGDTSVQVISYIPMRRQDVDSLYLETRAPLMRALEAQLSVRRDEYKTNTVGFATYTVDEIGDVPTDPIERTRTTLASTDYTVGLRYSPVPALTLRASYGTGFLPPGVDQLVPVAGGGGFPPYIYDPKNDINYFITQLVGLRTLGNPDLMPEESRSLSAGLILTPPGLPGLRLSVDYTRIRKTDEIRSPDFQTVINNEDSLPGRVGRSSTVLPGETVGRINYFDITLLNMANTEVRAYDFQADYVRDTGFGELSAYAMATWQPDFKVQVAQGTEVLDNTGFTGGPLEWRGNAGVNWRRGAWTLGWNMQYYHSYFVYRADDVDFQVDDAVLRQGSRTIPHQIYHDVLAQYRFGDLRFLGGVFADAELTVGIQNVLDKVPPILASADLYGSYSMYGDPRLRRYSISLRKSFQ